LFRLENRPGAAKGITSTSFTGLHGHPTVSNTWTLQSGDASFCRPAGSQDYSEFEHFISDWCGDAIEESLPHLWILTEQLHDPLLHVCPSI
jgi:hypothetical protein